jgi:hypothetical protein
MTAILSCEQCSLISISKQLANSPRHGVSGGQWRCRVVAWPVATQELWTVDSLERPSRPAYSWILSTTRHPLCAFGDRLERAVSPSYRVLLTAHNDQGHCAP